MLRNVWVSMNKMDARLGGRIDELSAKVAALEAGQQDAVEVNITIGSRVSELSAKVAALESAARLRWGDYDKPEAAREPKGTP
jgi:hypothetical protein